ncbi:hypothetical protein ACVILL_002595 [Bradyrhizobium sp. USDA 3364]
MKGFKKPFPNLVKFEPTPAPVRERHKHDAKPDQAVIG